MYAEGLSGVDNGFPQKYNEIAAILWPNSQMRGERAMEEHPGCESFQETVSRYLIRHRSVLDVMSKLQESCSRVNRALAKAVTTCGCLKINAGRQEYPPEASLGELPRLLSTHISGSLCPECRDVIETEAGQTLFYLAALCELLDLNMEEILEKEHNRVSTLGVFHLS